VPRTAPWSEFWIWAGSLDLAGGGDARPVAECRVGSAPRHYVTDRWINVNGGGGDPNLGFCGCRGEGGVLKGTN
jgi:hypothetical protein